MFEQYLRDSGDVDQEIRYSDRPPSMQADSESQPIQNAPNENKVRYAPEQLFENVLDLIPANMQKLNQIKQQYLKKFKDNQSECDFVDEQIMKIERNGSSDQLRQSEAKKEKFRMNRHLPSGNQYSRYLQKQKNKNDLDKLKQQQEKYSKKFSETDLKVIVEKGYRQRDFVKIEKEILNPHLFVDQQQEKTPQHQVLEVKEQPRVLNTARHFNLNPIPMISAKQSAQNFHSQIKHNPFIEIITLDQRNDPDLDEAFCIEDILKEDKMKEIEKHGDYWKHYGFNFDALLVQYCNDVTPHKHKGSIERIDLQKLPRSVSILTAHYLERSCNFLNLKHIQSLHVNRVVILVSHAILTRKILSITFWLFVHHVHSIRNKFKNMNEKHYNSIMKMKKQLEKLLQEKYLALLTRLHQPKEKVLEILPIIIAKAILIILNDSFNDNLEEVYGIFGFASECTLFVYQYVMSLFNQGVELPLNSVDKLVSKFICKDKQMDWHHNVNNQLKQHEKDKVAEKEKKKDFADVIEKYENKYRKSDDAFFEMQRDKMSKQVSFMEDKRQSRTFRAQRNTTAPLKTQSNNLKSDGFALLKNKSELESQASSHLPRFQQADMGRARHKSLFYVQPIQAAEEKHMKDATNLKAQLKGTIKSIFKPCNVEFESRNSDGKNNEDSTTPRPKSKDTANDDLTITPKRAVLLGQTANEFAHNRPPVKKKGIPKETFENERKKEFFRQAFKSKKTIELKKSIDAAGTTIDEESLADLIKKQNQESEKKNKKKLFNNFDVSPQLQNIYHDNNFRLPNTGQDFQLETQESISNVINQDNPDFWKKYLHHVKQKARQEADEAKAPKQASLSQLRQIHGVQRHTSNQKIFEEILKNKDKYSISNYDRKQKLLDEVQLSKKQPRAIKVMAKSCSEPFFKKPSVNIPLSPIRDSQQIVQNTLQQFMDKNTIRNQQHLKSFRQMSQTFHLNEQINMNTSSLDLPAGQNSPPAESSFLMTSFQQQHKMQKSFMQTSHNRSMQELGYLDKQRCGVKIPMRHNKEPRKHEEIDNGHKQKHHIRTYLQQHSIIQNSISTMSSAATKALSQPSTERWGR